MNSASRSRHSIDELYGSLFIEDEEERGLNLDELEGDDNIEERVVKRGSWTFDQHLLILKELEKGKNPVTVPLNSVEMWVQAYDIPNGFMIERIGAAIGNFIGREQWLHSEFPIVEDNSESLGGESMEIDIGSADLSPKSGDRRYGHGDKGKSTIFLKERDGAISGGDMVNLGSRGKISNGKESNEEAADVVIISRPTYHNEELVVIDPKRHRNEECSVGPTNISAVDPNVT
ncbi:hypothetical protein GH714_034674 [Hevea brasiliensis]|uniref:Uncharacterized protein n=1 Tax=Hevea brasiliensis TaxID=3981 RepID=A0A6A6M2W5_HEVBR|nr:hypothetical protein GH714_034674 [Hevea brasiliensis]